MHHIETISKLLKDELSHRVVVGPNPKPQKFFNTL